MNLDLKVLIVDDNEHVIEYLKNFCLAFNLYFKITKNSLEAKKALLSKQFDLVICDDMMPNVHDGLNLLKWARAHNVLAINQVKFILGTGNPSNLDDGKMAYEAKADAFLPKPYGLIALKQKIEDLFVK